MTPKPRLLFSAPSDFLLDLRPHIDRFEVDFTEVWYERDLPRDRSYDFWIPNPGQHFVIGDAVIDGFVRLRAIVTPSTGTNHIDLDACRRRGIATYSLLDDRSSLESISASAEFTFLHVLNALRRIDVGLDAVRAGAWRTEETRFRGHELAGRKVGLVGYGRIGRRLARFFAAFDCDVTAYDPYQTIEPDMTVASSLSALFSSSDVLVVCCSLTDETRGLIDGDLVRCLPSGAVLVNTSRGEVLREAEVVSVLTDRPDIVFAADVVADEVGGTHLSGPLVQAAREGRILVTPHIAGATVESQHCAAVTALKMLTEFLTRDLTEAIS